MVQAGGQDALTDVLGSGGLGRYSPRVRQNRAFDVSGVMMAKQDGERRRLHSWVRSMRLSLAALVLIGLTMWLTPAHLRLVTMAGAALLVLLAAAVLWLPTWLVSRDTVASALSADQRASAMNGVRATLVQGVVGLAALAGIFVAWQQLQNDRDQFRDDRQQLREQLTLTRQGQVAERFTRAVDQLGTGKMEQRLGGVYGLEGSVALCQPGAC